MSEESDDLSHSGDPTHQHNDADVDRMAPEQERASRNPLLRTLAYIGLDLTGPERASILQVAIYLLLIFIPIAFIVSFLHLGELWLFITSAAAIIPLAKI